MAETETGKVSLTPQRLPRISSSLSDRGIAVQLNATGLQVRFLVRLPVDRSRKEERIEALVLGSRRAAREQGQRQAARSQSSSHLQL